MSTFSDLGLPEQVLRSLAEHGYVTPTPIQDQAIPVIMARTDLIGAA